MRYRVLSADNDYTFGKGAAGFLVNTPETVAQAVATRLRLAVLEWFLDLTEGTPYATKIVGAGTAATYDDAFKQRILGTPNVLAILAYESALDGETRALTVSCLIDTAYGQTSVSVVMPSAF